MEIETKQCYLNKELVLQEPSELLLKLQTTNLNLIQIDNEFVECRVSFQVNTNQYRHIDEQFLFNLKSEVRSPFVEGKFLSKPDIQLEITLQPNLISSLLEHASNADEAAAYLLNLSQQHFNNQLLTLRNNQEKLQQESKKQLDLPQSQASLEGVEANRQLQQGFAQTTLSESTINPLLLTESWLCLSVKQQQGDTEIGFSTFWSYVSPTVLQQAATSGEQISEGIADFFKEWVEANLSDVVQEATDEFLEEITSVFQGLADDASAIDWDTVDEELFETVVSFFEANDWPIAQVEDETALQLAFQGENGQWACYAGTNEEREEFIFYSLCPVNVPENQRLAMAEFLTRANYGITIGNFEMDFDSGEIHYKTSINVEGDQLSIALVQQLVYANVMIMDQYLPGIMAVIYGKVSPAEAIAQIEG